MHIAKTKNSKCGSYMTAHLENNCGIPIIIYKCDCGFDTSKENLIYSNKTIIFRESKEWW